MKILRKAEKIEPYAHFCFNSQRDGILPIARDYLEALGQSFNSQRDGILRNFVRNFEVL